VSFARTGVHPPDVPLALPFWVAARSFAPIEQICYLNCRVRLRRRYSPVGYRANQPAYPTASPISAERSRSCSSTTSIADGRPVPLPAQTRRLALDNLSVKINESTMSIKAAGGLAKRHKTNMKSEKVGSNENTEFVESLDRGLRVIGSFGTMRRPTNLNDIAKVCCLPRRTTQRILATLQELGFVLHDGQQFSLTPKVLQLASPYLMTNQISSIVQPLLDDVAQKAKEVCSVAALEGDEVVFVALASPTRVFFRNDVGYRLPAFCTSVGRALLGRLNDDALDAALGKMELIRRTPWTILDRSILAERIRADRARGYSVVDQEAEAGFRSISVPIQRYDGSIIAAANIGTHIDRTTVEELVSSFLPLLKQLASAARPFLL
jgi:IclR family pca regulon transcriptional regulator